MSTSYNGWPVLSSGSSRLYKWVIPGTGRHLVLRNGSAGFLIVHAALWWHERVERLDLGVWDEWGHAVRPVRGSTRVSNHASGTAGDVNATRHPLGVPIDRTFTRGQIRRIKARMRLYGGCLVWGGVWSRPDGMHLEISAPLSLVEKVARLMMNTPRGKRILAANPGQRAVILS